MSAIEDHAEEKLLKCFNRTKKTLTEDVEMLQKWMQTQPHLPEIMEYNAVKQFLLYNKFSIEITKRKIDMYYAVISKISEILENINPRLPQIKKIMDTLYVVLLPKLTKDMNRVVIYKIRDSDMIDELDYHSCYGHMWNLADLALKVYSHLNVTFILDLSKISTECVKRWPFVLSHKIAALNKKVYGSIDGPIYIIQAPTFTNAIFAFVKTIVNPKVFERIHFCDSIEDLNGIIPKEILPVDYGGEERSLEELNDLLKAKFLEYQDWFDKRDEMRVDEGLRPLKLKDDDTFGFHGSFRKLEVD